MLRQLEIRLLAERFTMARFPAAYPIPSELCKPFAAVIHSPDGATVVCREDAALTGAESQGGFRCFEICGEFELASVGVVAAIAEPLARASIAIFAFSTWKTDYILVHGSDVAPAVAALKKAGHDVAADTDS